MKTRSEPFLWIHLGGIVMFPLFFLLTAVSLAVGESYSYWLEIPLLMAIAILPVLLMQLYRPFNIFSVLFLSLKPQSLTENQRRILALFQRKQQKLINALVGRIDVVEFVVDLSLIVDGNGDSQSTTPTAYFRIGYGDCRFFWC